ALHLPRRDQGHAVAKVPLRIRPRIGERPSGGEEGNERKRSAHVCARGQQGRAVRVVHAVVIPLLVRVVLVSGRSLLRPRLGRARLRAPHRHAHRRVLAFHLAAERYRPVSVPPHRDLKDPPRGHAQMERGPPEKVAIRVPYLGGGGGRDIPRGGVARRALIGWLGVRRPGCGVGGVCAIAPPDAFARGSGVEVCGVAPVNRERTALSCPRSSSMDWNRWSRSLAMQRSTTSCSSGTILRSGRASAGGTGASCRCLRMMSTGAVAVNGTRPVSM